MAKLRNSLLILLPLFILSSCAGSGGGSYGRTTAEPWVYKPQTEIPPAQEEPSQLADIYGGKPLPPLDQNAGNEALMGEGTQPQAAPIAPDLPPVKVALLLPLSGRNAALGQAMLNASQIALFDIGHAKFELIPRDTGESPQEAARTAQEVLDEGAQLILGPVFADSVRAVQDVASRRGVNVVAFSTDWTLAGNGTYLMGFLPFGQIERVVSYAAAQGLKRIGILAPEGTYGDIAMQAYRNAAAQHGATTVDTLRFSPGSNRLPDQVKRFARYDERLQIVDGREQLAPAPFDAIFLPADGDTARSVSNMAFQYGLPPQAVRRLGTGLWDDNALRSDKSLSGAWFAAPSPRLRQEFENRYRELYGHAPHRLATLAYDATALAAVLAQSGLQHGGRPAFDRAALTNPNGFSGIDGIFRFRSDGLVQRGLAVLEFRGGRIVIADDAPRTFQNYGSF